ncbi:MAG: hypothetical protein V4466_02000, partial [Pseudomonadota bacterium]
MVTPEDIAAAGRPRIARTIEKRLDDCNCELIAVGDPCTAARRGRAEENVAMAFKGSIVKS